MLGNPWMVEALAYCGLKSTKSPGDDTGKYGVEGEIIDQVQVGNYLEGLSSLGVTQL